jgi:uncharacterized protein
MTEPLEFPGPAPRLTISRSGRRRILMVVGTLFLLFVLIPWLIGFMTDWLWFSEVGFQSVYLASTTWQGILFLVAGALAFAFLFGNIVIARGKATIPVMRFVNRKNEISVDLLQIIRNIFLAGAGIVAFLVGVTASALWLTWLQAFHGAKVGTVDPIFQRDLGFYLFQLPAISALLNTLIVLTVLAAIGTAIVYAVRGEIVLLPKKISVDQGAARHVGGLIALLFILLAIRLWFVATSNLLYSDTGPFLGASYTDVHVRLAGTRLAAIVAIACAGLVIYGIVRNALGRYAMIAGILYVATTAIAYGVVPALVQRLLVSPNELARERPYLQHHISATQKAWGLDNVETRQLTGDAQLTMADIRANSATIDNVRLWERDLLQQTFGQLQEIRTYYDFVSVDDDRYTVDGKYRQVHLAIRELNTGKLPTRTFINERLTFTHGMGLTMAPVNQVTSEGLPVLFIKDLPPVSTISLKLARPQIYYGELTNSYVFVGTGQKEFDYPAGDANIQTNYTGKGGVPIGSILRRALYAWQLGSLKILLSNDIKGNARILYRREIETRARTALPFLIFDEDPYPVITDTGQIKWILDAYTSSDQYPYAQRLPNGMNYMRNSVKVVIDAYDGTIDAYIADPKDAVVRTYASIFEGIFKPLTAMPADLLRHVRYPGALFRLQTSLHSTYHMVQPETFYHREDQWEVPGRIRNNEENVNPFMRHIVLRLPGERDPEFIFMTPFTPRGKDNLAAWMVARMDGEHYGKLVVYQFPKQSLVYGPKQIENRINQDTEISRQVTLWDQRGSEVIRGELLVIPIEESLIYLQPLYLRAQGGNIPELKRVVVAHGNQVVMGETLEEGLGLLFGGVASRPSTDTAAETPSRVAADTAAATSGPVGSSALAALVREAQDHYSRAIAAQRAGDWAEYGRRIEQLGAVLKRIQAGAR